MKQKFYTVYDPYQDKGFETVGESLTRQSEADECDINKIMERFDRTGQLPTTIKAPPQFGDARITDFQTAKQIVIDAENAFKELPANARKYFNHDPENLLSAISDPSPEVQDKLLKLGILVERPESSDEVLKKIAKNTEKAKSESAQ